MSDERIKIEYRDAARGKPTLRFSIPSKLLVTRFIGVFRSLSEGPAIVNLSELPFIELNNIREIELTCIANRREPPRRLQPDKRREFFRWIHDSEGWIWCAELAEGLKENSHQYFDYGENNDVQIEASFLEDEFLKSRRDGPRISRGC
jgi:hypothetical protein